MNDELSQKLAEVFKLIPLLENYRPEDFQITPLRSYTNRNFRISNKANDWILRIPRDETSRFIDRRAETENLALAQRLGLAPERIWADESGLSLSATLGQARTVTREELKQEPVQQRLAATLNLLHRSSSVFQGSVDLETLLTRYYQLMPEPARARLGSAYHQATGLVKELAHEDDTLVPSHNDLVLENILVDESGKFWLIDWEYASMASPYWDIATLCNGAELNLEQSLNLLRACRQDSEPYDAEILADYRTVLKTLSDCWMAALG